MKSYWQFALQSMRIAQVYRASVWLDIVFSLLFTFLHVSVWRALLGSGAVEGTTVQDMVTYVILSQFITTMLGSQAAAMIEQRLHSGDICNDLIRPVSYRAQILFSDLGGVIAKLLFTSLPLLATAFLFFEFQPPASIAHLVVFVLMVTFALLISFYINYLVGLIAFRVVRSLHLLWFVGTIRRFLSGQWIPFWFYPDWLRRVADYSPFRFMFFEPISAYMGRSNLQEVGLSFTVMIAWLLGLILLEAWLWHRTVTRLVVQGG